MIHTEFRVAPHSDRIVSVRFSGHAGQNEPGYDIVCAAASALFIAVCNGLDEVANVSTDIRIKNGDSEVLVQTDDEIKEIKAQTLLQTLRLVMQQMQQEHPDYISVTITEEKK